MRLFGEGAEEAINAMPVTTDSESQSACGHFGRKGSKSIQCHVRLGGTQRDRPCPRPDPYRILRLRTANWVSAISCLAAVSGMPS